MVDSSASQASYHAREQLVGKTLPSDAVGTSKSVSGSLVLGADGSVLADQSKISVDLTKLQSDESRRDNFIKNDTLQTSRFPMATFAPNAVQGLPTPLPTSGQATFQLSGDLTVHGVTQPVTWQVTASFADHGEPQPVLPAACPFTLDELIDPDLDVERLVAMLKNR